jgi:hypothetical protein
MNSFSSYIIAIVPGVILGLISLPVAYVVLKRLSKRRRILMTIAISMLTFVCAGYGLGSAVFLGSLEGRSAPLLKPSREQLLGTWRMPDTLVYYLESKGISADAHSLTLSPDGTFEMIRIPNLWGAPWDPSRPPTSGQGTWAVTRLPYGFGEWVVQLRFSEVSPDTGNDEAEFIVEGRTTPFSLYIPKGEMGDALVLERE